MKTFGLIAKELEEAQTALLRATPDAFNDAERISILSLQVGYLNTAVLDALREVDRRLGTVGCV